MKNFTSVFAVILICVSSSYAVSADVGTNDYAHANCASCHDNAPGFGIPNLGGQSADYLFQKMKDYKSGARQSIDAVHLMAPVLKPLSDAEMHAFADSFSKSPIPAPIAGDPTLVTKGKDIYANNCAACHGENGEGDSSSLTPRISSQDNSFLVNQLHNYKSGLVKNQDMMSGIAESLSDDDIRAVSAFLQSK